MYGSDNAKMSNIIRYYYLPQPFYTLIRDKVLDYHWSVVLKFVLYCITGNFHLENPSFATSFIPWFFCPFHLNFSNGLGEIFNCPVKIFGCTIRTSTMYLCTCISHVYHMHITIVLMFCLFSHPGWSWLRGLLTGRDNGESRSKAEGAQEETAGQETAAGSAQ